VPGWDNACMGSGDQRVRLDKWLWAARFFKTRALATEAVQGGRVHVNDQRVKPARDVRMEDVVQITRPGAAPLTVVIRGISDRRGPATEARLLYEETPESIAAREQDRLMRAMAPPPPGAELSGRPTKRDRRRYDDARRRSR
jgi:ribosome-associated heat shock protein Hsp15